MKKFILPAILGLLVAVYLVNKFQTPCFDSLPTRSEGNPMVSIMLNKCTGETWGLVRTTLVDKDNKATGETTYRWSPLNVDSEEPRFNFK